MYVFSAPLPFMLPTPFSSWPLPPRVPYLLPYNKVTYCNCVLVSLKKKKYSVFMNSVYKKTFLPYFWSTAWKIHTCCISLVDSFSQC